MGCTCYDNSRNNCILIGRKQILCQLKRKCTNNSIFLAVLILCFFGRLVYVSEASSNVPIMDYWRYLSELVEKSFISGESFSDLCSVNGIHKTPYQLCLFLINIKLFHWNTQIAMYLASFVLVALCIYLYKIIKMVYSANGYIVQLLGAVISLIVFSLGAFEINAQEFALSFAIRIFLFIIICQLTSIILNNKKFDNHTWLLGVCYLLAINLIGGAYSVGLSVAILFVLIFDFVKNCIQKIDFNKWKHIILILSLGLGDYIYMHGLVMTQDGNVSGGTMDLIKSFCEGLLAVGGVSLFGSYISLKVAYITGSIIILVHAIFLFLYMKKKLYEKTYLPACLYAYVCIFYGMIFMGRGGYGTEYLLSSRYIIDSSLAIIADIIVIVLLIKSVDKYKMSTRVLSICTVVFIVIGVFSTNVKEMKMAPYRKMYDDKLIEIMLNIDNYSDDDLAGFQAQSPQQVREGVEIMKQYHLGVFYYK